MALILNIDTSTALCSVCLSKDGKELNCKEFYSEQFVHAEKLHLFINDLMMGEGLAMSDLSAVAISAGPGSYTGLRIGVSTAKGLAYGLNIPLISISTLVSMSNGVLKKGYKGIFCPMIDARRMEVYSCLLNDSLIELSPVEALVIDDNYYAACAGAEIYYFGSGAEKCKEFLGANFRYIQGIQTSSKHMLELSYKKYLEKKFEDIVAYEPLYLKEFKTGVQKQIF